MDTDIKFQYILFYITASWLTLKIKILIGLIFLVFVTFLIGGLGIYFIKRLADDSDEIIKDNYKSVEYAKQMLYAIDEIHSIQIKVFYDYSSDSAVKSDSVCRFYVNLFIANLDSEMNNFTETGEKELAHNIKSNFETYHSLSEQSIITRGKKSKISFSESAVFYDQLRQQLMLLSDMNMQAIIRKNDHAHETAQDITFSILIIAFFYIVIASAFLMKFPGYITGPIKKLTQSIRIISEKNYSERLDFSTHDEFGELSHSFNIMASRLQEYENSNLAKVLFEKKRIETIIHNMKDGILVLDEYDRILFANPTFCTLFNIIENQIIGKQIEEVLHNSPITTPPIEETTENKLSDLSHKAFKIFFEGKDAFFAKDIFDVVISNSGNPNSQSIGHVIILKNITHFRELDLAKTNFLATISHELKTPLSSVDLCLRLIQDVRIGNLNDEQKKIIKTIKHENTRLIKLVSELLDISQLESGRITMQMEKISVYEIILLATDALEFQLSQKKIQLKTIIPDTIPFIRADLDKTVWVMINLVTNAIRYTPENGLISIIIKEENKNIRFMIEDSGGGIKSDYLDKIFEKYVRIPSESGEDRIGTGLGLSTAKEFIMAQGGKIWAESELGKGSRFYFTLQIFYS